MCFQSRDGTYLDYWLSSLVCLLFGLARQALPARPSAGPALPGRSRQSLVRHVYTGGCEATGPGLRDGVCYRSVWL